MLNCENVVSQNGMTSNLELFLTRKKGWGVRTNKPIKKGAYIATYTGIIYPINTAQSRQKDFEHDIDGIAYKKYVVCTPGILSNRKCFFVGK